MRLIPSRYLENWHTEVDKLAQGHLPLTWTCVPNITQFPFDQVQQYTTNYIVNKKETAIAGLCDERLIKLVQKSDSKCVALAACSHLLSPQAVRTLIVQDFTKLEPGLYLQLILVAHHGTPNAVEELDSDRAKALLAGYQTLRPLSDGQYLKTLFEIIKQGVPKNSLVYSTLYNQVLLAIPRITADLQFLRVKQLWHQTWGMISWLSSVSSNEAHINADCLDPIELLDRNFRNWRMWAAWKPKESMEHDNRCDENQRALLHQFLALEGPDGMAGPMCSHFSRLLAQEPKINLGLATIGHFKFSLKQGTQEEARILFTRLYDCIGHASHHSHILVELFTQLFWGVVVSTESLDVMDAVAAVADIQVTAQVLALHKSHRHNPSDQLVAAEHLMPLLRDPKSAKLRNSATGKLAADIIMDKIQDLQAKLKIGWEEELANSKPSMPTIQLECEILVMVAALLDSIAELQLSDKATGSFLELVKHWPTYKELCDLQKVRVDIPGMAGTTKLRANYALYLHDLFIARGSVDQDMRDMLHTLASIWRAASSTPERKQLAILLAGGPGKFRTTCIAKMELLSDNKVLELSRRMKEWNEKATQDVACWKMTRFLAELNGNNANEIFDTWKPVLYRMLKARGSELGVNALGWKPRKYLTFFAKLDKVFGDTAWNPKLSPPILNPAFRDWAECLAGQIPALVRLEENKLCHPALRIILNGADPWILEGILCHLGQECYWAENVAICDATFLIVSLLTENNAQDVYDLLCSVFQMSNGGAANCARIINLCYDEKHETASLLLAGWIQDSSWSDYDQMGFKDLARSMKLDYIVPSTISTAELEAIANYMEVECAKLLEEAQRLDTLRVGLKMTDYEGVSQLLYDHMIEDTTWMEDSFAKLPVELLNVVERVDDSEVEIIFPLTDITPLHRAAMGIGNAQSLLVRLHIEDYGSQPKFCIHLDNEPKLDSHDIHSQWTVFKNTRAPELPICHGTVTTATYQLARVLSRFLVQGFTDLSSIHTLISTTLKAMGSECLICGTLHGAVLRRPIPCEAWECGHIFSQSPIEIRLADIRNDPLAVDMILSMIHSAINSGYHNLLTDCPFDQKTCLLILSDMPSMETIQRSKYLWATIKDWHDGKSEQFLTWAICSFRGFLSTATGNLRIPSLPPGTLQFILANAAPLKEISFASEFATNAQQSRVMFHGTTLDRLYLILHQGLKVMSGTTLQAYGSAYGSGIYLAEDPGTSWAYAKVPKATQLNWKNSAIKMDRILLGCEMTNPASVPFGGGIHVVPAGKEGGVMVRYIFVVPKETVTLPIAGHVGPAMMSVYNSLRSRAI